MIDLDCKDNFLKKSLENLLLQKKLISIIENQNFFSLIYVKEFANSLVLTINKNNIEFKLPIDLNIFVKNIYEELNDIEINFADGAYFPYQRLLKNKNNKKIYLSYLQNIILSNLIVSKEGIEKFVLYKIIWPKDINVSINKLDTHLTNLKVHINANLCLKINFQSQNKVLKLIIN